MDGRVFIGQFSTTDLTHINTWLLIKAISDGDPDYQAYTIVCPLGYGCLPGDTNEDKCVDIMDFLRVLELWGPSPTCDADFDFDGAVGINDLLIVLAEWDANCIEAGRW